MITPDYLNEIMQGTESAILDLNEYLMRRIAKRILNAFMDGANNLIIPATQADMKLLMQGGMLYEEIEAEITKRLPQLKQVIKEAFLQSAQEITEQNQVFCTQLVESYGLNIAIPSYEKVKLPKSAKELYLTSVEIKSLENAYKRTNGTVSNMVKTMPKNAVQAYTQACDNAYVKVKRGIPLQQAVVEAIKEVSDNGLTVDDVIEYSGRKDKPEVAIARAVRTGINQASSEIVLERCAELGVGYVKVSEHLGARVTKNNDYTNHSWWQGQVYSLDWNKPELSKYVPQKESIEKSFEWMDEIQKTLNEEKEIKYPDFVNTCGYGKIQGIIGINCRHTFFMFDPKVNIDRGQEIDPVQNEKMYKLTQQQRALERKIRKIKRQIEALKATDYLDEDAFKEEKKKLNRKLKQASDDYMSFCRINKLKPRNMSLKV